MSRQIDQPEPEGTYHIDAENVAEMARLTKQSREATIALGLFPQRMNIPSGAAILDIGCGPGEWALSVAREFPESQITGIDLSSIMIAYAQHSAREQELHNASFIVMDARQPLKFSDEAFDIVHMRFLSGFLTTTLWPRLIAEGYRVLRPGGLICSTEGESLGITTSPSLAHYNVLQTQALRMAGHCFTSEGDQMGITAVHAHLLRDAGFHHIQEQAYAVDYSAGMPRHQGAFDDWRTVMKLMQPYLIRCGLATQAELDILYERALAEMSDAHFRALTYLHAAWGEK
ncbi:MAG TPA: methyltransferase domain-containing protein [Ktedonobacteraceae bacterium]|nr:methyltransferase domain-containing protein [Ktedonobacteraceae bacterium]